MGWYLNGEKFENLTVLTEDIVIEAKWRKNQSTAVYYNVTVSDVEGGSVTVSPLRCVAGTPVMVTVSEDIGYAMESVSVTDSNGRAYLLKTRAMGTTHSRCLPPM